MGRKRTKHHGLPPRMAKKGNVYWYVCRGKPRKWLRLGPDLARAKRKWAELEGEGPPSLSVADLVQRYIDLEPRPHSTILQYRSYHKAIAEAFPIPAAQLRSSHVSLWKDMQSERRVYANGIIGLLIAAFRYGAERDLCGLLTVSKWGTDVRSRDLLPAEFLTIRERSPAWLQLMMDLGYLTSLRPSDIRALRWSQVSEEGIRVRTRKTDKAILYSMTPELAAVLSQARQRPIMGLFVVANERGRGISRWQMSNAWLRASKGIEDAQFRDIRALSAKMAKKGGQDYQALLGHTNARMSERYIKGRETVIAEPVRRKL